MTEDKMKWYSIIAPKNNLYFSCNYLYPEMFFAMLALNAAWVLWERLAPKNNLSEEHFYQDMENELNNAGLDYPVYCEKCIEYCQEFCSYFPNENELIIHNMRRSIVDSYIHLKKMDEAKRELDSFINDYPNNPWSYIAYGDMYWFGNNIAKDPDKAKEYYERALLFAKDEYDKKAIEERLKDIKE